MCTRKGYAASVSQLPLATAAQYFLLLMLKSGRKRSALQPRTIYSEVPLVFFMFSLATDSMSLMRLSWLTSLAPGS